MPGVQKPDLEARRNPGGNERLTAAVGLLVLIPVLVEIVTVLLGVHTFMSLHVFVGLALIPAVLLKLGSTGWRFARYYTRSPAYVTLGPPQILMRVLAPLFVAATVVLFGSGIAMGLLHGRTLQIARNLHGPASVIWLASSESTCSSTWDGHGTAAPRMFGQQTRGRYLERTLAATPSSQS